MREYKITTYVYPLHLEWTLEGIVMVCDKYGVNLHDMKISRAMRNFNKSKTHKVEFIVCMDNERRLSYIERRLQKEIGLLK